MTAPQRIDRVKRDYNKWVANQTFEDFALRFTAKKARRFSSVRVGQTALGAVSFLALEAISGSITLHYGFTNTIAAIVVTTIIIFAAGIPVCFYAAEYGVDIDLLTRGAGFGYIGSTITSLVYASFTFILFAIESAIMAIALNLCLDIPLSLGYLFSALAVVPLVTHGITAISRFQVWTQPFWIALNILPVVAIAVKSPQALVDWQNFAGSQSGTSGFQILYFGQAASVVLAFIVQLGEQVDYLRFLPRRDDKSIAWWSSLLLAGPGWIAIGVLKLLAGSFLAVYLVQHGVSRDDVDPPHMYATAFQAVVGSPALALALTCAFVVICQLKINVTNAYAGSIAWSNFFSRLTHYHPGRVVWLVFNVILALLVMELGVYRALEQTLTLYSSVAVAWIGAIVADLVINKPLGLSPPDIEFKRAHLYDINPVGVGAMTAGTVAAVVAHFGAFGPLLESLAPFLALAVSVGCAPLIAVATGSRYYIARQPDSLWSSRETIVCCICENAFEPEDVASCPAYAGPICSLCCSLDARCHDMCKPGARIQDQIQAILKRTAPQRLRKHIGPHVVGFILTFGLAILLVGGTLGLIGMSVAADHRIDRVILTATLWKIFFLLAIVAGVVSWLVVLVQMSRRAAESEMQRQAQLLMTEIEAHERTDAALKKAKEVAEAANLAKSRYIRGLSHELRTPLNTIMGYAQLLERDRALGARPRDQVSVMRRSATHLAGLIDGLLDISKIEAGKLNLSRDEVAVAPFLAQMIDMFTVQAESKGIAFVFEAAKDLPAAILTDEKRLRQILINLLSNAVKFTKAGEVSLIVRYRNEVAEFLVRDTGPGIALEDQERIFEPFERLQANESEVGTGLGLTICRLLASIMGGDIRVKSELGAGSTFSLRLFLPRHDHTKEFVAGRQVADGPFGAGKTILVVDDDPMHRTLIAEALTPFAFSVQGARNAVEGLAAAEAQAPDIFFLDIEMPGMDGWQLARTLRERGNVASKIVMLSASAIEEYQNAMAAPFHDAFVMKPVDLAHLMETVVDLLGLDNVDPKPVAPPPAVVDELRFASLDEEVVADLIRQCEIGYVRGLRDRLTRLAEEDASLRPLADRMLAYVDAFDLRGLITALERLGKPVQ